MRRKSTILKVHAIAWVGTLMIFLLMATAGHTALRINMKDGTTLEVSYFWEENGEYRFEIAGGVVGVPKNQVESVHEILASREFDPEVILDDAHTQSLAGGNKVLRGIVEGEQAERAHIQNLSFEESRKLLAMANGGSPAPQVNLESVYSPELRMEGNFADLVRINEHEVMLLLRNVVSTRNATGNLTIYLALFDGDGNLIQRKSCELFELSLDNKTMRELGTNGRIFTVMASVKPDPKIRRYEIIASRR